MTPQDSPSCSGRDTRTSEEEPDGEYLRGKIVDFSHYVIRGGIGVPYLKFWKSPTDFDTYHDLEYI